MRILDLLAGTRQPALPKSVNRGDRVAFIDPPRFAEERPDLVDLYRGEGAKAALAELDQKLVDEARQATNSEAVKAKVDEAVKAENTRALEILKLTQREHRTDMLAEFLADPKITVDAACRLMLERGRTTRAAMLAALQADEQALQAAELNGFDSEGDSRGREAALIKQAGDYAHRAATAGRSNMSALPGQEAHR